MFSKKVVSIVLFVVMAVCGSACNDGGTIAVNPTETGTEVSCELSKNGCKKNPFDASKKAQCIQKAQGDKGEIQKCKDMYK